MSSMTDPAHLRGAQYADSRNLNARASLHARFGTRGRDFHRWVFDQIDAAPDARILEVGGGPGWLWRKNADRIPPGWRVTHTDFSPGMVDEARAAVTRDHATFAVADAQALQFGDAAFDVVIANHMLYHVPDRARAMREFRRVLAPGGRLLAATNGAAHMAEAGALRAQFARESGADLTAWPRIGFTLENGAAELRDVFPSVRMLGADDTLRIDDMAALADYLLSMGNQTGWRDALIRFLAAQAAADGFITVHSVSGLFIAAA